jgi:flagellar motor component MotA
MGLVFAAIGMSLIVAGILLGGELRLFLDVPSVTIVFGCTVAFTFAYHSVGKTFAAFGAALGNTEVSGADAQVHIRVLSTVRVLASASGVMGSLIGLVNMLANMDDPKSIGPAMAVALLTVLYGVFIAEVCMGPLINRLRNRASALPSAEAPLKVTAVTFVSMPAVLLAFFILLLSFQN